MIIEVTVKSQFVGFHHWPEAPKEVGFLADLHRHVFYVELAVEAGHEDRQVEFFILQGHLNDAIASLVSSLRAKPSMSCEHMATYLYFCLVERHSYKIRSISVSEDNENKAKLIYG